MKADYVHKDSKTSIDETISYKITMPLINNEELQRIDNTYNELVDEFTKQFVKEKDMIIAQRLMMNLRKENKQLLKENEELNKQLDFALKLLSKMSLPCEKDEFFMNKHNDYCEKNCGLDEEFFKKCWLFYIDERRREVD